jgi:hypothetical protein
MSSLCTLTQAFPPSSFCPDGYHRCIDSAYRPSSPRTASRSALLYHPSYSARWVRSFCDQTYRCRRSHTTGVSSNGGGYTNVRRSVQGARRANPQKMPPSDVLFRRLARRASCDFSVQPVSSPTILSWRSCFTVRLLICSLRPDSERCRDSVAFSR